MGSNRLDREMAWIFIKENRNEDIKLRINLTDETDSEFEYTNYHPIISEGTLHELVECFEVNKHLLPHLTEIVNMVMGDLPYEDRCSDQNVIENLMTDTEKLLEDEGYLDGSGEMSDMVDLLDCIARDLYNYIMFALVDSSIVRDDKLWEFLKCTDCYIADGKLYMTVRLYVEELKDLDLMDERSDVEFEEIVDELKELLETTWRRRSNRSNVSRDGNRSLLAGLVA